MRYVGNLYQCLASVNVTEQKPCKVLTIQTRTSKNDYSHALMTQAVPIANKRVGGKARPKGMKP